MKIRFLLSLLCVPLVMMAQYHGTASVTHGLATTVTSNLNTCTGGRTSATGTITASDNTVWTVPAEVNYNNSSFPFASDLNNPCNGHNYSTDAAALAALDGSDIINVDSSGEVITAFVFADNYFEMYVNGVPVGKDNVPYTQFNSNIVRFRVKQPFTVAMQLVDWEEHLGVGAEASGGFSYHLGDAGMVAVFKDVGGNIISTTGSDWKAQTFYTAPIMDLTCPTENGTQRLSGSCSTQDSNDGSNYYGLHWAIPANWTSKSFDDSSWPDAITYTNAVVGVNNKPAYTNFTNIFDDASNDAQFIWSSNLVLDNEVIVRKTIGTNTAIQEQGSYNQQVKLYPNPATSEFYLSFPVDIAAANVTNISIYNAYGQRVFSSNQYTSHISTAGMANGVYLVTIMADDAQAILKLVIDNSNR